MSSQDSSCPYHPLSSLGLSLPWPPSYPTTVPRSCSSRHIEPPPTTPPARESSDIHRGTLLALANCSVPCLEDPFPKCQVTQLSGCKLPLPWHGAFSPVSGPPLTHSSLFSVPCPSHEDSGGVVPSWTSPHQNLLARMLVSREQLRDLGLGQGICRAVLLT